MRKLLCLGWLGLTACAAPAVPVKPPTPVVAAPIRRIAVPSFAGNGGAAATQEFIRALTGSGLQIASRQQGVDAVLQGTVTDYKTGRKFIVILGNTRVALSGGQTVPLSNPVISLTGAQVTPRDAAAGLNNPQMMVETALVGISLKLVQEPAGPVLWADQYSYEGLTLQNALQAAVRPLAQSLQRTLKKG